MVRNIRLALLAASMSIAAAPAFAGGFWGHFGGGHSGSSSSSGSTSPTSTSGGSATPVPEPGDALLLLMGAAGVVIGRRLHARKTRKP